MESLERRGLLYVATKKESFMREAAISAASVKRIFGTVPVTLFTNLPHSLSVKSEFFDEVNSIATVIDYSSEWAQGQLDRIQCLNRTPYNRTLHLDTDTQIRRAEFQRVFEILDDCDIAMVECADDASISRHHYGRPMFNVGFILYRKNEKTARLFQEWERLTRRHFEIATQDPTTYLPYLSHISDPHLRRQLLFMDQLSFVQLLSPEVNVFDLRLKILEEQWNFRGASNQRMPESDIIVDHRPSLKQTHANAMPSFDSRVPIAEPRTPSQFFANLDSEIDAIEQLLSVSKYDEAKTKLPILLQQDFQTTAQLMRVSICCHRTGLNREAAPLMQRYLQFHPQHIGAHTNMSIIFRHLERFDESLYHAREALRIDPRHRMAYVCLITTFCKMESSVEALNVCNEYLFRNPADIGMMALKIVALSKLGDLRESRFLQDYERLVRPFDCFTSEDERLNFNHSLANVIQNHTNLKSSPDYHATRNGLHSGNLRREDAPEISRLIDFIDQNVNFYLANFQISGHPFFEPRTTQWKIRYFWSVVMQNAGHQIPHSHPTGWLSGVYYCKIPKSFGEDLKDPHGWIEFGRPDENHYGPCKAMDVRVTKPELGRMILFPSYYWHSTVPLKSEDVRISFAFDIVRA